MSDISDRLHENIVHQTYNRLRQVGRYDTLYMHKEYHQVHTHGECDILAVRNGNLTYYEIKSTNHEKAYNRAIKQFKRFRKAFLGTNINFVYVAGNTVRRIRL